MCVCVCVCVCTSVCAYVCVDVCVCVPVGVHMLRLQPTDSPHVETHDESSVNQASVSAQLEMRQRRAKR